MNINNLKQPIYLCTTYLPTHPPNYQATYLSPTYRLCTTYLSLIYLPNLSTHPCTYPHTHLHPPTHRLPYLLTHHLNANPPMHPLTYLPTRPPTYLVNLPIYLSTSYLSSYNLLPTS
jgi:hypothetical protein